MGCDVSGEQLWSWIDEDAPELEEHLAVCASCRERAAKIREDIGIFASEAAEEFPFPEKIGPYSITRLLGEGGQALVFEAEQPSPKRRVALKVLKGGYLVDKNRLRRFRRETQALARLNHPSIATIYEAGRSSEGLYYFAMELVDGVSLGSHLKKKKPSRKEVLELFLRCCGAIQYAHEQGVIHRDLKPSNIMVTAEGLPKILDFGLVRLTQSEMTPTVTATKDGRVEGTPRYMSPEQALGLVKKIDERSDVYSLGVVLYEILTGRPPSDVSHITPESIRTICEVTPRKPSVINPDLKSELDAIILKALEKEPGRRYQTVAEMADDVLRFLSGEPVAARSPSPLYLMKKKVRRRWSWATWGAALVAAVMIGFWISRPAPQNEESYRRRILSVHLELFRDGATEVAFYQASDVRNRFPQFPEATLVEAQAQYLKREKLSAIMNLTRAIENDPNPWPYRMLLDELQLRRETADPDEGAERFWNDDLAASADAWYLRSFATLDVHKALQWSKEAMIRDPDHELALTSVANLFAITGQIDSALTLAEKQIERNHLIDIWIQFKFRILVDAGRAQDAVDECNRWMAERPGSYRPLYLRAKLMRRLGRYADADSDLTTSIEHVGRDRPASGWHYYHRGTVRWLLNREEDAIADYRKAYEFLDEVTFANARLYILLNQNERIDEANAVLADARENIRDAPWLQLILDCLGGRITPGQLGEAAEANGDPARRCEGYYYAGEAALLNGSQAEAHDWFQRCLDTGVMLDTENGLDPMSEYELARMRINQFGESSEASAVTERP
ncbi:MAG: protein kinase [Candidatus Latescibacterota bacterium]